jgi:hypothetical protein
VGDAERRATAHFDADVWEEDLARAPTFHDLRHTHASALIAHGWDIESVSARLEHRDVATTQRIYIHEFDAANRSDERRAKLAALYGGNAIETTGRRRAKQTHSAEKANTRKLRATRDSR